MSIGNELRSATSNWIVYRVFVENFAFICHAIAVAIQNSSVTAISPLGLSSLTRKDDKSKQFKNAKFKILTYLLTH